MIHLQIYSKEELIIERAAALLIHNRLAIDLTIDRDVERLSFVNDKVEYTKVYLLSAKTKSLLFQKIEAIFRSELKDKMPELYSLPIVQMDWKQAEHLTELTQKV
ncbi:MAG: hypothetical protein SH856_00655 [Flavobacteriales bacterium]|nr:hypothetical protein [Flavobacteriales bacterium]